VSLAALALSIWALKGSDYMWVVWLIVGLAIFFAFVGIVVFVFAVYISFKWLFGGTQDFEFENIENIKTKVTDTKSMVFEIKNALPPKVILKDIGAINKQIRDELEEIKNRGNKDISEESLGDTHG
jgi:heme/copper-type cytochrome/quinol oxidase subunit 2